MAKVARFLLWFTVIFAVIVVTAVLAATILFPSEKIRTRVEAAATEAVGAPVTLGDIGLSFAGIPAVKASDIVIGGERGDEPPLFRVSSVRVRVDILKLLSKTVEIVSVEVSVPEITMITRSDGS